MKKIPALLMSMFLMSIVLTSITWADTSTYIYGTIYDNENMPITHAKVTVQCASTKIDQNTDKDGMYKILNIECSADDIAYVTVTKDGIVIGTGSGTIDDMNILNININIDEYDGDASIPEFPIAALPALLSMFSFGLIRKRLF